MGKEEIGVDIKAGIVIDTETVERALRLVEWYLNDNPCKELSISRGIAANEKRITTLSIKEREHE